MILIPNCPPMRSSTTKQSSTRALARFTILTWMLVGASAFHNPQTFPLQEKNPLSTTRLIVSPPKIAPRLIICKTNIHSRSRRINTRITRRHVGGWDGDDIRWFQKMKRRISRRDSELSDTPARTILIVLNVLIFAYQTMNTVGLIRRQNPQYWPGSALSIVSDTLLGSTNVRGPLTTDFVHFQPYSQLQPHRFLTAGFLHGDILHLLLNLDALRRLPTWLETGLGTKMFITTFLVSIVSGNVGHSISSASVAATRSFCLGASGGICGLYGLMYVSLIKMGRGQSAMSILKSMLLLLLSGFLWESISNVAHVGGFIGGVVMGLLCAPNYGKDYSMRRKNSLQVDNWPRDYRQVMGFGVSPTKNGVIPVSILWAVGVLLFALEPKFQSIPSNILRGLMKPGSLSYF